MHWIHATPGRTVQIEQEEWLYFSGTSYLGIARDPYFCALLQEGVGRFGSNFGGSRLSNIQFTIIAETEQLLAQLTGAPQALTVSSGTLAGQLVVRQLSKDAQLFYAPGIHPALLGPGQTSELSFAEWTKFVQKAVWRTSGPSVLLANAIDPLHAESYDWQWLHELPTDGRCTVVIDDSHYLGVGGRVGGGTYSELHPPNGLQLVVVSSLGKAFGVPAGVILGPKALIEAIQSTALFGGASPASLAHLYAFVHAQERYAHLRTHLQDRIAQFSGTKAARTLFRSVDQFPVFYTPQEAIADWLAARRVMISSFRYPDPQSDRLTRVVLNAAHTAEDIQELVSALEGFFG